MEGPPATPRRVHPPPRGPPPVRPACPARPASPHALRERRDVVERIGQRERAERQRRDLAGQRRELHGGGAVRSAPRDSGTACPAGGGQGPAPRKGRPPLRRGHAADLPPCVFPGRLRGSAPGGRPAPPAPGLPAAGPQFPALSQRPGLRPGGVGIRPPGFSPPAAGVGYACSFFVPTKRHPRSRSRRGFSVLGLEPRAPRTLGQRPAPELRRAPKEALSTPHPSAPRPGTALPGAWTRVCRHSCSGQTRPVATLRLGGWLGRRTFSSQAAWVGPGPSGEGGVEGAGLERWVPKLGTDRGSWGTQRAAEGRRRLERWGGVARQRLRTVAAGSARLEGLDGPGCGPVRAIRIAPSTRSRLRPDGELAAAGNSKVSDAHLFPAPVTRDRLKPPPGRSGPSCATGGSSGPGLTQPASPGALSPGMKFRFLAAKPCPTSSLHKGLPLQAAHPAPGPSFGLGLGQGRLCLALGACTCTLSGTYPRRHLEASSCPAQG